MRITAKLSDFGTDLVKIPTNWLVRSYKQLNQSAYRGKIIDIYGVKSSPIPSNVDASRIGS